VSVRCEFPRCAAAATRGAWCQAHWVRLGFAAAAAQRAAPYRTPAWRAVAGRVRREEPICRACRLRPTEIVDHRVERRDGGTDDRANLQGLCWRCHSAKTARRTHRGRPRP
jgi:5-methylcytosine-specific restriction endonuclease McrA